MNLTLVWQLAWRYLRGKRSANAVPILSRISMFAIAIGTAAMIILLSVLNGFNNVVEDLYKAFYPEIRITAAKGKFFSLNDAEYNKLQSAGNVAIITKVLEDNILLSSETEQRVATIKGVDSSYVKVNDVKPYITEGAYRTITYPQQTAVIGSRLLSQLGLDVNNVFSTMVAYYPNAKATPGAVSLSADGAFRSLRLRPDGVFTIQDDFDGKYVLADLGLVQGLLQEEGKYSSVELALKKDADIDDVKKELQILLGSNYKIETRFEQNKTLYMVMRAEKWAVYAIVLLVLLIAAFNMVGALSLLVLEKQRDIGILKAIGARPGHVSGIFLAEGVLWSLMGGGIGLLTGALLCMGQQHFGWIQLGGSFIISAYPVQMQLQDFLLIIGTIISIGLLAAWFPAARAARVQMISLKSD